MEVWFDLKMLSGIKLDIGGYIEVILIFMIEELDSGGNLIGMIYNRGCVFVGNIRSVLY